jgi:flavodoxin
MKTLVVFYSLDGNTKLISKEIAEEISGDLLELTAVKPIPKTGFARYFFGGMQSKLRLRPKLLPFEKNPENYDLIFIGMPVWAGTYGSPMNTLVKRYPMKGKRVALFCCYAAPETNALKDMKALMKKSDIVGIEKFRSPLKKNTKESVDSAVIWARNIMSGFGQKEVK